MDLTCVRYQDSCIYIDLNGSQDRRENGTFQKEIRNAYVVYKIKAFDRQVRETVLIGKRDIFIKGKKIVLKLELNELWHPEECEFELISIKINFANGKSEELKLGRSFKFLEIQYSTRVDFTSMLFWMMMEPNIEAVIKLPTGDMTLDIHDYFEHSDTMSFLNFHNHELSESHGDIISYVMEKFIEFYRTYLHGPRVSEIFDLR